MACNIEQAIDALLTFKGTATHVTKIIEESAAAKQQFDGFVTTDSGKTVSSITNSEYINSFTKYLKAETGVNIVESLEFVRDFVLGKSGNVFRQGELSPATNTLTVADSNEIAKFVESITTELDSTTLTNEERTKLEKTLANLQSFNGETVLLHELVHATSVWSLRKQPNSEASSRVSELFEYVLKNYPDIGANPYWKTNTQEFLSEALSSPKLMEDLMNINLSKPIGNLTTVYATLVHIVLGTLGFKGKELDTAYKVMLDSSLAMLEDRKKAESEVPTKPVKDETSTKGKDTKPEVKETPGSDVPAKPAKLTATQSVKWDKLVKAYESRVTKLKELTESFAAIGKIKSASKAVTTALNKLHDMAAKVKKPKVLHGAAKAKSEASEVVIGGSEQDAIDAVNLVSTKSKTSQEESEDLTQEDADELQRMYEEEEARVKKGQVITKEEPAPDEEAAKPAPVKKQPVSAETKDDGVIMPSLKEQANIAKAAAVEKLRALASSTKSPVLAKAYTKQADDIENNTCGV